MNRVVCVWPVAKLRPLAITILSLIAFALSPPAPAMAWTLVGNVSVDARSSIFFQESDPTGARDFSGMPTTAIALPAGTGRYVTFPSVTGVISSYSSNFYHSADGGTFSGTGVDISTYGSISGMLDDSDRTLALLGVFSAASYPNGSAPARLDFRGNHSFATLSPQLNQTFYIGDGRTAAAVLQKFFIPNAANFLQLGFADAFTPPGDPFIGLPSYFQDNLGSLSVGFSAVPEPSSFALAILGALGLLTAARRNSR